MDWLDIPEHFDPINRIEGAISTFLNADWDRAYRRHGILGLVFEFVACVTSYNAPTIQVARQSCWRGIDIERLLKCYGVNIWDRGLAGDNLYFCVKRRQFKWAQYVLLCAGVPVTNATISLGNYRYIKRHSLAQKPKRKGIIWKQ